jgi:hypothetical protein
MSAATTVEILAAPPAIRLPAAMHPAPLSLALPLGRLIEERQTPRSAVLRAGHSTDRRDDTDHIAGRNPVDLVARTDAVPFGDDFRDGDLELARDPGHGILA